MSLARVHWSMGQTLLPRHLSALEESVLADNTARFNLYGLPGYGLAELRWNEALLGDGVLSLDAAKLVTHSGLLLCIGNNARCEPLNLNIADSIAVTIYLHVIHPLDNGAENLAREFTVQQDETSYWLWSLNLSFQQDFAGARESIRLADFEKQPNGEWILSERYVPPSLQVGTTPFFQKEIADLTQSLEAYRHQLIQESAALYLSGEDLVNAKLSLKSTINLLRFLANLRHQIKPHPYWVYEALKNFYMDICCYQRIHPQFEQDPYQHDDLATCFGRIVQPLKEQLRLSHARSPYLPFALDGGIMQARLTAAVREATEIYLLVQKNKITDEINLGAIKIAAVSRISLAYKFSLQGIPFKRIDKPLFQHSFGPEVDIYQLGLGDEWDYALNELALGFYTDTAYADVKFFLYWRSLQ